MYLNSDSMIILPIVRVKNMLENVDWNNLMMADKSYLVKIVLIMHNKCSQADIAHNCYLLPCRVTYSNKLVLSNKQMADPQAVYRFY